jgi:SNF2 family DNA or RNA helicase
VLRRVKEEVAKDLPPRLEKMIVCALSSEERTLYDRVLTTFSDSIRTGVAARVPSIALEALLRLRQCCALPQMLPNPFCPDISCPTSKLDLAEGLLLDACASNRKSLFFSQFTAVLDTLEKRLRRLKIGVVRLDGSTMDRAAPVQLFQNDEQIKVFLIAFRAGGFGLNLTAAERVILYDPWWNAAAEEQAFARAHRIGQRRGVLIQRLVCSDTVEQKMVELRDKKEELARTAMEVNTGFGLEEMKALIGIS